MNDEINMDKFKVFINEINENTFNAWATYGMFNFYKVNTSMNLIYDYKKLNVCAKTIMENSYLTNLDWNRRYDSLEKLEDIKNRIEATKKFIKCCKTDNKEDAYRFIFWAMMILAVDKTDMEKNLSVICDFAAIMNITDDEMEDIFKLIKIIFHQKEVDFQFKSTNIPNIFSRVIELYK